MWVFAPSGAIFSMTSINWRAVSPKPKETEEDDEDVFVVVLEMSLPVDVSALNTVSDASAIL